MTSNQTSVVSSLDDDTLARYARMIPASARGVELLAAVKAEIARRAQERVA